MSTIDDFAEMLRDSITKKTFVLNQNGIHAIVSLALTR